jgi:hypothetical protein
LFNNRVTTTVFVAISRKYDTLLTAVTTISFALSLSLVRFLVCSLSFFLWVVKVILAPSLPSHHQLGVTVSPGLAWLGLAPETTIVVMYHHHRRRCHRHERRTTYDTVQYNDTAAAAAVPHCLIIAMATAIAL